MAAYLDLVVSREEGGVTLSFGGKPVVVPPALQAEVAALTLDLVIGRCETVAGVVHLQQLDLARTARRHPPSLESKLRVCLARKEWKAASELLAAHRAEVEKSTALLFTSTIVRVEMKDSAGALADWKAALALGGGMNLLQRGAFTEAFEKLYQFGDRADVSNTVFAWAAEHANDPLLRDLEQIVEIVPLGDWPPDLLVARSKNRMVLPPRRLALLKEAAKRGFDVADEMAKLEEEIRKAKQASAPPVDEIATATKVDIPAALRTAWRERTEGVLPDGFSWLGDECLARAKELRGPTGIAVVPFARHKTTGSFLCISNKSKAGEDDLAVLEVPAEGGAPRVVKASTRELLRRNAL